MAEFYATYEKNGKQFLAIVIAPTRPACLRFENRESLLKEMDALGHEWQLQSEIEAAVNDEFLQRMALMGELKPIPKPTDCLFTLGSILSGGAG